VGPREEGKSGGVRAIYYYVASNTVVYMLLVYSKSEQSDMTSDDRKAVKKFVESVKSA